MKNYFSTLFYSVSSFMNNETNLFDLDILADDKSKEFADVFRFLKKTEVEPSQDVINRILAFSQTSNINQKIS